MKFVKFVLSGAIAFGAFFSLAQAGCPVSGGNMMMAGPAGCSHAMGGGNHLVVPVLLLALGFGYWILTLAHQQERFLSRFGKAVGWVMIVIAAGCLIATALCGLCRMKCKKMGQACAVPLAKMDCHTEVPSTPQP